MPIIYYILIEYVNPIYN